MIIIKYNFKKINYCFIIKFSSIGLYQRQKQVSFSFFKIHMTLESCRGSPSGLRNKETNE